MSLKRRNMVGILPLRIFLLRLSSRFVGALIHFDIFLSHHLLLIQVTHVTQAHIVSVVQPLRACTLHLIFLSVVLHLLLSSRNVLFSHSKICNLSHLNRLFFFDHGILVKFWCVSWDTLVWQGGRVEFSLEHKWLGVVNALVCLLLLVITNLCARWFWSVSLFALSSVVCVFAKSIFWLSINACNHRLLLEDVFLF